VLTANRAAHSTAKRQRQNGEHEKFSIRAEAGWLAFRFGLGRGEWFRLLMFDLGAVISGAHRLKAVLCSRTHHGVEARENRER
jgi:hypothetical protein